MKDKIDMYYGASNHKKKFAKLLRRDETPTEKLLWEKLKSKQLGGYKFRRQHALGHFVADFYCHSKRLVVEIDGHIHDHQVEYDAERTRLMEEFNITVIRFSNERILMEMDVVLEEILSCLNSFIP